jgi:hypothetical protein
MCLTLNLSSPSPQIVKPATFHTSRDRASAILNSYSNWIWIEFVYSYTLAGAKKSKATNDTVTDKPLLTIVCCARDTNVAGMM